MLADGLLLHAAAVADRFAHNLNKLAVTGDFFRKPLVTAMLHYQRVQAPVSNPFFLLPRSIVWARDL